MDKEVLSIDVLVLHVDDEHEKDEKLAYFEGGSTFSTKSPSGLINVIEWITLIEGLILRYPTTIAYCDILTENYIESVTFA